MNEETKKCSLYLRVSAEYQSREVFSLSKQQERLEIFCKFKNYTTINYYEAAGISAKTGNYKPKFEKLKADIKSKKVNTVVDWISELSKEEQNKIGLYLFNTIK